MYSNSEIKNESLIVFDTDLLIEQYKENYKNIFKDYFIDQEIRVFPNEVYYFDHPKFGVVISIKDKP